MPPPKEPRAGHAPDNDDPENLDAGWDPYVASLLARDDRRPAADDTDGKLPVMSLARVEARRR